MQNSQTVAFSLIFTLLFLTSCVDNNFQSNEETLNEGHSISFCANHQEECEASSRQYEAIDTFSLIDESDSTRRLHCHTYETPLEASIVSRVSTTIEATQISQIGVIADASWFGPRLMSNDLYTRGNDGVYSSENVRYWIDDANASINFYAFAPYRPTGLNLPTTKGLTTLNYNVPASTDNQVDLMLAVSKGVNANYGQPVDLAFKHLLAGVKINFTFPSGSTITGVKLTGLTNSATLDFASTDPMWTMGTDHTLSVEEGEIGTFAQFMVLPQTISDTQPITLSIQVDYGDEIRTYSHVITSGEWRMGINTIYDVTITNYSFDLSESAPADAHYVIYKTNVIASNLRADTPWTVTCSASDGANVTIQKEEDLNSFAKQGFWTDKVTEGTNETSARGTNSLTLAGNGTFPVSIFMPENATDADRTITINIHVDGKSTDERPINLTQLHPSWTSSGFGWEQTDDNINGEYGFKWNRIVYYGYVYSAPLTGNNTYRSYCQSIIDNNNASNYADVTQYNYSIVRIRYAIRINYGNLSDIGTIASSQTDGLNNTKGLFNFGGAAATNAFVTTLDNIKKTEQGHETEPAFRLGNGNSGEAPAPEGDPITSSTAVGECMKKNRYNLIRSTSASGDVSLTATIKDEDIVWYMPAVNQFSSIPSTIVDQVNAALCWSSTSIDDRNNAYLGNKEQVDRLETHSIRAIRNHP